MTVRKPKTKKLKVEQPCFKCQKAPGTCTWEDGRNRVRICQDCATNMLKGNW